MTLEQAERLRQIIELAQARNPVFFELQGHAGFSRRDLSRLKKWTIELSEGTAPMDEDDYEESPELILQRDPIAQWISGQCELAAQIDKTKDPEAKQILRDTMQGVKCLIDPPRGQLVEVKK